VLNIETILDQKESKLNSTKQSFISNINVDNFNDDFYQASISVNISLHKLRNATPRYFLEKYNILSDIYRMSRLLAKTM